MQITNKRFWFRTLLELRSGQSILSLTLRIGTKASLVSLLHTFLLCNNHFTIDCFRLLSEECVILKQYPFILPPSLPFVFSSSPTPLTPPLHISPFTNPDSTSTRSITPAIGRLLSSNAPGYQKPFAGFMLNAPFIAFASKYQRHH